MVCLSTLHKDNYSTHARTYEEQGSNRFTHSISEYKNVRSKMVWITLFLKPNNPIIFKISIIHGDYKVADNIWHLKCHMIVWIYLWTTGQQIYILNVTLQ